MDRYRDDTTQMKRKEELWCQTMENQSTSSVCWTDSSPRADIKASTHSGWGWVTVETQPTTDGLHTGLKKGCLSNSKERGDAGPEGPERERAAELPEVEDGAT